jgi:phage tail-like protein
MYDQTNTEVARWNFVNGWPSKLDGPSLSSEGNEVSVESLTIVHEGIVREK